MRHAIKTAKRSINLSISANLIGEAKALDINISAAAEEGLERAVKAIERQQAEEAARRTVQTWNAYIDRHGSPADEYGDA